MPKAKPRKGTHWDQLKEGLWLVVIRDFDEDFTEEEDEDEPQVVWGLYGPERRHRERPRAYDGVPFKVLAMSYPFLCVTEGKERYSLDFRRFDVQIVNSKYADAVHTMKAHDFAKAIASKKEQKKLDQMQKEDEEQKCKRCGMRMQSQKLIKPGSGEWVYYCPNCDGLGKGAKRQ